MCDEEIFEINDFSTSSDWERFISDLEEILTQWNLNNNLTASENASLGPMGVHSQNEIQSDRLKSSTSKLFADPRRWQQKQDSIKFGKVSFSLQYFCFKKDLVEPTNLDRSSNLSSIGSNQSKSDSHTNNAWNDMNSIGNDWPASGHPLVRYYGLSQFLVLSPLNGEIISTEDRALHLIGSASIALHNIDCEVPFFCQISALSRRLFMGVGHVSNGFRTYFEMIQFPELPPSYQYFNELMVLFKKKLYSSFSYVTNVISREEEGELNNRGNVDPNHGANDAPKVQVSIRFTYILTRWPAEYLLFNSGPNQLSSITSQAFLSRKFSYFRQHLASLFQEPVANQSNLYGDPLIQMQLATTWPSVAEELITDNAYHSDLQPSNAPRWSLRALFLDIDNDQARIATYCRIVELLGAFLNVQKNFKNHNSFKQNILLNHLTRKTNDELEARNQQADVRQALDRLISPSSAIDLRHTTNHLLTSMSNLVLQDESKDIADEAIEELVQSLFQTPPSSDQYGEQEEQFKKLKSAPTDSIAWRIAILCANLFQQTKQLTTLAKIWKCFLKNLRDYWQQGRLLPEIFKQNDCIDYQHCLLQQKLQMLNCCIRQKIKRELQHQQQQQLDPTKSMVDEDPPSMLDSDDEFFDAEDEPASCGGASSSSSLVAEGQLHPLKDPQGQPMDLLSKPGQQIQVPQTQDPAPMTEDVLAKQVASLSQIEDPKLKIRLQSASLLSDMEAFKAANPGCQFEDFIRWHSPRDWTETGTAGDTKTKEYGLSKRMKDSNTWNELWQLARACPIRRQKRLFNYTKEAEEILQSFQSISIEDFVKLLNPVIAKAIILQLNKYRSEILVFFQQNIQPEPDANNIDHRTRMTDLQAERLFPLNKSQIEHDFEQCDFQNLCLSLMELEYSLIKFYSIFKKLQHSYSNNFGGGGGGKTKSFETLFESATKSAEKPNPSIKQPTTARPFKSLPLMSNKQSNQTTVTNELSGSNLLKFILNLLQEPEVEFSNTNWLAQLIVQIFSDADRFQYEQRTSVGERAKIYDDNDHDHDAANQDDDDDDPDSDWNKEFNHRTNTNKIKPAVRKSPLKHKRFASLPKPTGKEFIIRARSIPRPAPYSRVCSHRMYCLLSKEFRLATAFTEDTGYY